MALPNLRRLFVEARTEAEENEYSRNAVCWAMMRQSASSESLTVEVLQSRIVHLLGGRL